MKIGNYLQKKAVRQERPLLETEAQNAALESEQLHDPESRLRLNYCLWKLIATFPRHARVLNLIHQGYKSDEVSQKLKIRPDNVYGILSRARSMLENCFETGVM